ncbi:hypothetical protein E2562_013761 [Oryza meyeriana var. granulata]|uniref:Uncharacterized protein n=1 Tax=Oryza meyeriana var. granulata TaxID=110450 RepID=A0A6G1F872_9ORYZ|nr:hypothetical protein E2562_013761 [Oryza meyeriana var. granulata]
MVIWILPEESERQQKGKFLLPISTALTLYPPQRVAGTLGGACRSASCRHPFRRQPDPAVIPDGCGVVAAYSSSQPSPSHSSPSPTSPSLPTPISPSMVSCTNHTFHARDP